MENLNIDPMVVPGTVVKNHGPFAWGNSPANAVYNAVILEKIAEIGLKTLVLNPNATMQQYILDKHYKLKTQLRYGLSQYKIKHIPAAL